ncbi:MAG: glycoside hydrolase N-terminal domain-containing protein [Lentisphaeria bacterium]|nr:glycoside hydrolase N-terminal domain-containing protein [Lentisphaeria bacterium]
MDKKHSILLKDSASSFMEGFPIGTGKIAAMIYSTYPEDKISLNHEWLWTANFRGKKSPDCSADKLPELRRLLREKKFLEANEFGNRYFSPRGGMIAGTERIDHYSDAGYFHFAIEFGCIKLERSLDMQTGVCTSSIFADGTTFYRECFADLSSNTIIYRVYNNKNTPFNASCHFSRAYRNGDALEFTAENNFMAMQGQEAGGIFFRNEAKIFADGAEIKNRNQQICINNAREIIAVIAIDVNINGKKEFNLNLQQAEKPDWEKTLAEHIKKHQKYYNNFQLDIPNDEDALRFFNYGRYLLIASCANAELPPNLQGKWNDIINPPWQSDYHLNINLQMNCWGMNSTGLADFHNLLFDYCDRLAIAGKKVAEITWGAEKGFFLPHATDVWAEATPEANGWSVWLMAGAWISMHYMKHYRYTLDETFLVNRAWPFIKGAANFYASILEYDENGTLEINPSQSPENYFVGGGQPVSLCISAACDVELLSELLRDALWVAEKLDIQNDEVSQWREMYQSLPELKIGKDGRLLEWQNESFQEIEIGHRHISHLIGLYPGSVINQKQTPELYEAARKTMEFRLANFPDNHSGWSDAWMANFFTRFNDGNRALDEIHWLATGQSSCSLLDRHPPQIFQIDGNLGVLSAVTAMLVQTIEGVIYFLPALPDKWSDGEVKGLGAENALTINLKWQNHKVTQAQITAKYDCVIKIADFKNNNAILEYQLKANETISI